MWTKWLLVLGFVASACAGFSGLQNDLAPGYSYRQPEEVSLTTIPASLAYYINIPAGQSNVDYYYLLSNNYNNNYRSQYNAIGGSAQDGSSSYRQQQFPFSQDLGYNRQQQPETTRVSIYRSYSPNEQPQQTYTIQSLPAVKIASDFGQSAGGYQVEPRGRSNQQTESPYAPQVGRSVARPSDVHQDHRDHSAPSQDFISQPPQSQYSTRDTSQFESKGFGGSAAKQNYRTAPATASLPSSYNAQLPFAIGAVPIKFKPFPLKTHLRQSGLLPITSYQARESYKK